MQHQHTQTPSDRPRFWRSRYGVAFLIIAAVAAYFLLKEHTAHVAGYLPFLLLAACPLMHLFMHRGHSHGGHDHAARQGKEGAAASKEQKQQVEALAPCEHATPRLSPCAPAACCDHQTPTVNGGGHLSL